MLGDFDIQGFLRIFDLFTSDGFLLQYGEVVLKGSAFIGCRQIVFDRLDAVFHTFGAEFAFVGFTLD
ncbi:hypothetical protein D3C75_1278680 [compost metagenome]